MTEDQLIEALADLEHDRWARWQRYLHGKCVGHGIPDDLWLRWERQIATPYADLVEREKESDRKEARRTVGLLRELGLLKEIGVPRETRAL
ncbi:MAG: hypothetical protein GTN75_00130 [Gemmatimonadetes bacterium]|nr:hypothetical protein [Gemmatimonadota bacterium]